MRRLEKRKAKESKGGCFKPKERVLSSSSVLQAPADAPSWSIRHVQPLTPPSEDVSVLNDSFSPPDVPGNDNEPDSE